MVAKDFTRKDIDVVDLSLDSHNPRFEEQDSSREVLVKLALDQGRKLFALAKDIAENGPNPAEMPIVIPASGGGYVVLEGNRRIAAIKLATEPKLVDSITDMPQSLAKRFKALNKKHDEDLPMELLCAVAPSRKKADRWIELRHTGENEGVGIIPWSGLATARFRGASPENRLLEHVKGSEFLDDSTRDKLAKISITNLERLLGTPEARKSLGIVVKKKDLFFESGADPHVVTGRLAIVVSDIANRYFKVSQLDTKEQRVAYAQAVAARPLPTPGKKIQRTVVLGQNRARKQKAGAKGKKSASSKRKTLIPKSLHLNIAQPRIARIFDELKRLRLDQDFENSCAVLLRVFLDMSVTEYALKKRISLKKTVGRGKKQTTREQFLKERVVTVIDHFVTKDATCKKGLSAIRTAVGTKHTIFSVTNWHEYVHNSSNNPVPGDLMRIWDNAQPLFEKIWE